MAEKSGNKSCRSPASLLDLERFAMGVEPASLSDFQKGVYDELECPVCLEIAVPPVTLCKTGHFICGICRPKLQRCVICRENYTDARSYAIENIVSKIKMQCRNKPCAEILNLAELGAHLKNCDYRPIVCNLDNGTTCKDNVINYEEYMDHLKKCHFATTSVSAISKFGVSSLSRRIINERRNSSLAWPKIAYDHHGVTFLLNMEIKEPDVFFWVSAFLTKADARNMLADLQIGQWTGKQISSGRRNIKWTIGILPAQMSLSEIKDSGDCVAFPSKRLISVSGTNAAGAGDEPFAFCVQLTLRNVQTHGTSVSFEAPSGTDEIMKNNVSSRIDTWFQCITCMEEYKHKSLEELRLEDYQFGRKGSSQQATELSGTQIQPTAKELTTVSSIPTVTSQPSGDGSGRLSPRISHQSQSMWACVHCTFLNGENNPNCGVCNHLRAN